LGVPRQGPARSNSLVIISMQDVIKGIKFGDDQLRGLVLVGGGQNLPFPIDFAGRPYNSATLPRAL